MGQRVCHSCSALPRHVQMQEHGWVPKKSIDGHHNFHMGCNIIVLIFFQPFKNGQTIHSLWTTVLQGGFGLGQTLLIPALCLCCTAIMFSKRKIKKERKKKDECGAEVPLGRLSLFPLLCHLRSSGTVPAALCQRLLIL